MKERFKNYKHGVSGYSVGCRCDDCKVEFAKYIKRYMKKRHAKNKELAVERLGGSCVFCLSTENLEFDHINPEDQSFRIGVKAGSYSWEKLKKEVDKCQLLCNDCHKLRHKLIRQKAKAELS